MISRLDSRSTQFPSELSNLLKWDAVVDAKLQRTVTDIIADVRTRGDVAVVEYTNTFDRRDVISIEGLRIDESELNKALNTLPQTQKNALLTAHERVVAYHALQKGESWQFEDEYGSVLGQKVTPMDRVGIYVPGGKASYPSSVLMNAVPAKVAGVESICMVVPSPDGLLSPLVLAAAAIAGVSEVITIGGAQAVAALAYGTNSIQRVDKIVGPGNSFVAEAKRQVFGVVGLDMIAGPSEILVVCDGKTNPDWIAMDLFSQAEHDEVAQAILLCPDANYLDQIEESIAKLLPTMPRKQIIEASLANRGALILVNDIDEAIDLVNQIAPEHLELSVDDPDQYLPKIRHAGAIFMGRNTPEAFGDYCAGPNHVLPTSTTARFSSPLGVYDFQKRSSIINCSESGASKLADIATVLAEGESLFAHAESARMRKR